MEIECRFVRTKRRYNLQVKMRPHQRCRYQPSEKMI